MPKAVSLSSLNGQHGVMQVRMDLRDDNGLLNNGKVWMQADDVDVKPWLGSGCSRTCSSKPRASALKAG